MAGEIQFNAPTGVTCYSLIRNAVGQIWNGASFVAYVTANLSTYAMTATEQGTASGFFTSTMPAVAAGIYSVTSHQRVGGSPAETDPDVAEGDIQWDGTLVLPLSSVPISGVQSALVALLLETDIGGTIENAAAVHSLATAILKLVSGFDLGAAQTTAKTFKTDGITVKMSQAITKNANLVPTQTLGVGA